MNLIQSLDGAVFLDIRSEQATYIRALTYKGVGDAVERSASRKMIKRDHVRAGGVWLGADTGCLVVHPTRIN